MMRMLLYRDRLLHSGRLGLAAAAVWFGISAFEAARAVQNPGKFSVLLAAAAALLPIAVLYADRIPIYLFSVYALLVPFSSILITGGGETLTKFVGVAAAGSLALAMILRREALPPSKALFALFVLSLYAGLTVCWSIDAALALKTYGMYLSYMALYAVVAVYPASKAETRLVTGSALAGAIGLAGYGGYLFWHAQASSEPRAAIILTADYWIDPNEYAATLLTPISIALMMCFGERTRWKKTLWIAALVLLIGGFAASGSRGGLAALAAMLIFLTIRSKYRRPLLAIFPPFALAMIFSPMAQRLAQGDVLSADMRTDIWAIGYAALHQYWLAGAGIGNFQNAYAQYFLSVPHAHLMWYRPAHSIVVQSAVEYGIPGLLMVLAVWYTQYTAVSTIRGTQQIQDFCLALQAGVIGLFVAGLSLDLMVTKYTWLAFALISLVRSAYGRTEKAVPT